MSAENPHFGHEFESAVALTVASQPGKEGKHGYYLISAGDVLFGTLSIGNHWRTLGWYGANIFQAPEEELLDKLHPLAGKIKKHERVTVAFTQQTNRNNRGNVSLQLPLNKNEKSQHELYEGVLEDPSKLLEIRYDIGENFRVVAFGADHKISPNLVALRVRPNAGYTPEMLEWVLEHHAEELPLINLAASINLLSRLKAIQRQ